MPTSILDLPPESHDHICSQLEDAELSALRLACRYLAPFPVRHLFEIIRLDLNGDHLDRLETLSLQPGLPKYVRRLEIEATF